MQLSETHERVFYSVIRMAEEKLHSMASAIQFYGTSSDDISAIYRNDVPTQLEEITKIIEQVKEQVESFYKAYQFDRKEPHSLRKELEIKAIFLWEEMADSTVERMKGYGPMDIAIRTDYEKRINSLIKLSEQLIAVCKE